MRWTDLNFLLLQLLPIFASVYCFEEYDLYPFSEVLNSGMDNTNPCNDFYQYVCGKWIERNEIPDIFEKWNVHAMTELSTEIMMKEILENPNIDKSNEELFMEKRFYDACMDEDYSPKEGKKLLEKMLDETPQTSWQDVVEYYATKFSAFDLFHIKLTTSDRLQIERPLLSKSNMESFEDMKCEVTERVKWLFENIDNTYIFESLSHIELLNESLAFIDFVNQITRNSQMHFQIVSISYLQELYNYHCPSKKAKIEWLQFFQKLADGGGSNFTKYDELSVDLQYLIELCNLLSETSEHAIDYLQYNFLFNNDMVAYTMIDRNQLSYTERYLHCIRTIKITEGITKEILKSHVPQESKNIIDEMFNNIKAAAIKEIENSWLTNLLKETILHKARGMGYRYGTSLDRLEQKLNERVTYEFKVDRIALQNELNLKRAQIINIFQVYEKAHKLFRAKRSSKCNACYNNYENEFVIGVALMFPPFFYKNAPIGFNYGRMGFIIAHEISHAFDYIHLQRLIRCISSKDEKEMMESMLEIRKNCFVIEFNSSGIDGLRTLDENVADTQGLKLAWKAMNTVIEGREITDEGLPYFTHWNQKELFFLSFANQWCSNPEYREDDLDDEHAPHVTRTLGTLKNMNEFAETYHCTKNETMNPITKCDWWAKSSTNFLTNMFEKLKKYIK